MPKITPRIAILNGPNLDLLGEREPEIYGATTLSAIKGSCQTLAKTIGVDLVFVQSNTEGRLVELVQQERGQSDVLVINPAGLSFRSVALRDALTFFDGPVIELHLSNIHARDAQHRVSLQSAAVTSVICGLGAYGYVVALLAATQLAGVSVAGLPDPALFERGAQAVRGN